eukprot:scaffold8005_cov118-Isochrysis_galbana.AAC.1
MARVGRRPTASRSRVGCASLRAPEAGPNIVEYRITDDRLVSPFTACGVRMCNARGRRVDRLDDATQSRLFRRVQ